MAVESINLPNNNNRLAPHDSQDSKIHPITHVERQRLQEKCGITALVHKMGASVGLHVVEMQKKLQHRGEDNAGIVTIDSGGKPFFMGGPGRVADIFSAKTLPVSDRMIGHNRYGTSGGENRQQPVVAEANGTWIAVAHNGNIPPELRVKLREKIPQTYHDALTFDSAEIAYAIAYASGDTWPEKIANALRDIPMAYALTMLTDSGDVYGLVGPSGHWPLWVGENTQEIGIASETRALPEADTLWSVKPGELVHITPTGSETMQICSPLPRLYRCSLHEVYGAKPDSRRENGELYGDLRQRLGMAIAQEQTQSLQKNEKPLKGEDVIYVGVPTSGELVARGYAQALGETLTQVISLSEKHKNGNGRQRSFIAMTGNEMEQIVAGKFTMQLTELLEGKRVVVIDDSVIRGNTLRPLLGQLRALGAKELHVISGLTEVVESCSYGYNILQSQGLIALGRDGKSNTRRSLQEIAHALGADTIYYPSVEVLRSVLGEAICTDCLKGGEKIRQRNSS